MNTRKSIHLQQLSGVTPVPGPQSLFGICVGLLHLQVLDSSAPSPISLPFPLHFGSLFFLPSGDQVNIRLSHLLSPMPNTCPYHFNMLFAILSRIVSLPFFSNYFIPYFLIFWMFLQMFSKSPFLYLTAFRLLCDPLSKFNNRSLKCFSPLCKKSFICSK
jgi:hypothetical protein